MNFDKYTTSVLDINSGNCGSSSQFFCQSKSVLKYKVFLVSFVVFFNLGRGHLGDSVAHPTLDFSSGHDITVREFEPHVGFCTDRSLLGIFSLSSVSAPPLLSLSLSK